MQKIFLALGAFLFGCGISDGEIRQILFGKNSGEILFRQQVNIDDDSDREIIIVGGLGQEEALAIIKPDNQQVLYKKGFYLLNRGAMIYNPHSRVWQAGEKTCQMCIIRKLEFQKILPDEFNSVFLEVLTEQPDTGLVSFPLVIRRGKTVYNGLNDLSDLKRKFSGSRFSLEYSATNNKLSLLNDQKKSVATYAFENEKFVKKTKNGFNDNKR